MLIYHQTDNFSYFHSYRQFVILTVGMYELPEVMMMNTILCIRLLLAGLLFYTGISIMYADQSEVVAMLEIKTDEAMQDYIANLTSQYKEKGLPAGVDYLTSDAVSAPAGLFAQEMKSAAPAAVGRMEESSAVSQNVNGAKEYTTTNIQVAGVDEADFVKNDNTYIYIVSGNTLSIVRVFPPQTASVVSKTSLVGSVSDIFLAGDRLIVFTNRYDYPDRLMQKPSYYSYDRTSAQLYDISDRQDPKLIRGISAPGSYQNARMIGDYVYFLTADSGYYYQPSMPVIYDNDQEMKISSVFCPPYPSDNLRMNTLTSFPVTGGEHPKSVSFLLGYDTTLYVSPTDVFVAYQKDRYGWYTPVMEEETLITPESLSQQKTVIHRFAISSGDLSYKSTGTVPGYLLNQFSLDQYEGNLRVATTVQNYATSIGQWSNVYILNPDLKIIGRLENLAPGEKIYSARFMGDLLYLVTFKQTDPLFVIDLSNPTQPGILGELKIPGYSDYLHPFDKTHLIGIGKDTYETSSGAVIPTGIKVALFDVSELNNPRVVDSRVIGEKGSDSAVLTDHRAFLLDKRKNIMVLPIKEVVHTPVVASKYDGSYTEEIWQGAYVFGIDPKSGFVELGKISHGSGPAYESWWSGSTVKRSIFMDTVLYTISQNMILGSNLKDLESRVMKVELNPSPEQAWYLQPLWKSIAE